jgi:hypothetical protein
MLPDSCLDFIEPKEEPSAEYLADFLPFKWFFVCGYIEAWHGLVRFVAERHSKRLKPVRFAEDYGPRAVAEMPPAWRGELDLKDWESIAERQFNNALKNWHLPFAKGALAITALKLCARDHGWTSPLLDSFKICPALYVAHNLKQKWRDIKEAGKLQYGEEFMSSLKKRTRQNNEEVFEELAGYASCTFHTVRLFIAFLEDRHLADGLRIEKKTVRACPVYEGINGLNPARFEICQGGRHLLT